MIKTKSVSPGEDSNPFMWKLLVVLLIAEFTSAFELTMIYAGMKTFIAVFKSPLNVGWLVTAYFLIASAASAICGRLGDLYGRRRVLLLILLLAATGSIVSATSHSLGQVIVGRALQGFAGAILPLCYGLLREHLRAEKLAYATGILAASIVFAAAAGLVIAGFLIGHFAWNGIFMASAGMALVSLVLCSLVLPHSPAGADGRPLDLLGGLLFAPGICMLLLGLSYGRTWGWTNIGSTLPLLGGGAAVLGFWARHELRTINPLIDLRLLARPRVALANLGMCGFALAFQQQILFLLLQQPPGTGAGFGIGPAMSGLIAVPAQCVGLIAAPLIASLCSRWGSRPFLIIAGLLLTAAIMSQMGSLVLGHYLWIVLSLTLLAVGSVALYSSVPNIIMADVPSDRTSEAMGVLQVNRSIAQAISAQLTATLLATSTVVDPTTGAGPFPSYLAYMLTIGVAAVLSLNTLVAGLALPKEAGLAASGRSARLQ